MNQRPQIVPPTDLEKNMAAMQAQERMAASAKANTDTFILNAISQVYAALVAKYGSEVPLETLADQAQSAGIMLANRLGLVKVPAEKLAEIRTQFAQP